MHKDQNGQGKMKTFFEEVKVLGNELADKVKGTDSRRHVRRLIIKDEHGQYFVEIPVTVVAVGTLFAPILAAVERSPRWRRNSPIACGEDAYRRN